MERKDPFQFWLGPLSQRVHRDFRELDCFGQANPETNGNFLRSILSSVWNLTQLFKTSLRFLAGWTIVGIITKR